MNRGYSLLELIVVLGIMALVIVVATPTVQASVERMTLRSDARTVMTALRRLRAVATRFAACSCSPRAKSMCLER